MTENEIVEAVRLGISVGDKTASDVQAKAFVSMAVANIGKMTGVDFNRKTVTFSLTASTQSYIVGKDILTAHNNIVNIQDLFRTDTEGWPIKIVSVEDFNIYTKGGSSSGAPEVATIDRDIPNELVLRVYPIPDSAYPCSCTVRVAVSNLQDIPDRFHPAIYAEAVNLFNVSTNPSVALQLANQNKQDIRADGYSGYDGGHIDIDRRLYRKRRGGRATSWNLTNN